jgi:hypothetical protein
MRNNDNKYFIATFIAMFLVIDFANRTYLIIENYAQVQSRLKNIDWFYKEKLTNRIHELSVQTSIYQILFMLCLLVFLVLLTKVIISEDFKNRKSFWNFIYAKLSRNGKLIGYILITFHLVQLALEALDDVFFTFSSFLIMVSVPLLLHLGINYRKNASTEILPRLIFIAWIGYLLLVAFLSFMVNDIKSWQF